MTKLAALASKMNQGVQMPSPEEQQVIREILRPLRSPCVVELGANTGEDEVWIRDCFQERSHYVMVEPDPRNVQEILKRGPTHRRRRLIVGAVADYPGMRTFHFSEKIDTGVRVSGSLRTPTGHLEHFPTTLFHQSGLVQCYTLDQIFEMEWLTKISLLWADIQGAEDMMIQGGQTALQHTQYLFMEVEKVELYAGQQLRDGLIAMLPGWRVVRDFEYNILMENPDWFERGPR